MFFVKIRGLYVITSADFGWRHEDIAEMALKAGARIIQLREKKMPARKIYEVARKIRKLCDEYDAIFIVNDRLDIAMLSDADGVHVGKEDPPADKIKEIFDGIVGVSVDNAEEAKEAEKYADYVGVGPVFETTTKPDSGEVIGLEGLKEVKEAIKIPVVAIGGINKNNIREVIKIADAVAVVSAIASSKDPYKATKELLKIIASEKRF